MKTLLRRIAASELGKKWVCCALVLALGGCSGIRDDRPRTPTEGAQAERAGVGAEPADAFGARLRNAERQLADWRTENLGLQYEIARQEQRVASLTTKSNSPGLAVEQFELRSSLTRRLGDLDQQARSWQETIDGHTAALRAAGRDPRAPALRAVIEGLSREKTELARQRKELVAITKRAR